MQEYSIIIKVVTICELLLQLLTYSIIFHILLLFLEIYSFHFSPSRHTIVRDAVYVLHLQESG